MSVSVTKAGPYFASGSISFSQLKSNFGGGNKFSDYLRNTSIDAADPIVPDSTENEKIATSSALKYSHFRNSIKRYYATQSGTDHNSGNSGQPGFRMGRYNSSLPMTGIDWSGGGNGGKDGVNGGTSGNLTKNIQKYIYITGVCGSYYTGMPAAQLAPETSIINVRIDVSGQIYAASGSGGTAGSVNGGSGGIALNVSNAATNLTRNLNINVQSGSQIYSGGGGGGKGINGSIGSQGTCSTYSDTTYAGCGGVGACPAPSKAVSYSSSGGNDCKCGKGGCKSKTQYVTCRTTTYFAVPGAPGGTGGNGGNGQGYNQSRSNGEGGTAGTKGGCPTYGGDGVNGGSGGDGGDWGESGQNGTSGYGTGYGSGGSAGAAISITSNNYTLTGSINSSTIRGSINKG